MKKRNKNTNENNAADESNSKGATKDNRDIVMDSSPEIDENPSVAEISKAPKNMEIIEQDHTRIRVLDFLVLNIEAASNIIKNNTVKTSELTQIYGSFLKNHSNAERILAQSVELIK
mgnify:CR=1 FL=1